jgi:hypothetical protein
VSEQARPPIESRAQHQLKAILRKKNRRVERWSPVVAAELEALVVEPDRFRLSSNGLNALTQLRRAYRGMRITIAVVETRLPQRKVLLAAFDQLDAGLGELHRIFRSEITPNSVARAKPPLDRIGRSAAAIQRANRELGR